MGTISNIDLNALQSFNIGFSSWRAPSLPSFHTSVSSRITGDLGGNFNSSSVYENPTGQYNTGYVTWKTGAGVMGAATLEIVYGIGSPGEEWDYIVF